VTPAVDVPYRGDSPSVTPPLSIVYIPFSWIALLRPLALLAFAVWLAVGFARRGAPAAQLLEGGSLVLASIAYVLYYLPIVRIRAELRSEEIVLRGRRWPGAEIRWLCAVQDAEHFEVETLSGSTGSFYRLALRTTDGKRRPLTEKAYRGVTFIYPPLIGRLDAWLASARTR
jgi:hypothetical protein